MVCKRTAVIPANEDGTVLNGNISTKIYGFHLSFTNKQSANSQKKRGTIKRRSFRIWKSSKWRKKYTDQDQSTLSLMRRILEKERTTPLGVLSFFATQKKKKICGGNTLIRKKNHITGKEKDFFFLWAIRYSLLLVTDFPEISQYSRVFRFRCASSI